MCAKRLSWSIAVASAGMVAGVAVADPLAQAQHELEQGHYSRAASAFGELLRQGQGNQESRLQALIGRCQARYQQHLAAPTQSHLAQQAFSDCKQAIELQADYPLAYRLRGMVQLALQQPRPALADLNVAVALDPKDFLALQHRGMARTRLNQVEGAMEDFNAAIRLNPDFPGSYYYRGQLHSLQNRHDAAVADFNTFFQLVQRDGTAYSQAERNRLLSGRDLSVADDFNRVLQQQQQQQQQPPLSSTSARSGKTPAPQEAKKARPSPAPREEVTDPLAEVILDASLDADLPPARSGAAHRKGSYAFKIESFRESANADKALARVSEQKMPVYVEPVEINHVTHLRVWVGPFVSQKEAEAARRRLHAVGFTPEEVKSF
ncbi:tetratricopeptide repeat protein [Candidatus Magnetaquicoccus inordinatus]|uniref:tetratricopeptide repeat protein n=1 Tax=Candidatus Magnetaquicoccus inordinatus TaxID=2496818 RepID=UPI00102B4F8F|nr:tetratricopeptide repeat protein [Candidatus Magnetaquicoccus inordinatus]